MEYLNVILLCALIAPSLALNLGLNKESEGHEFRFYNYDTELCISPSADGAKFVTYDCTDSNATFTIIATPTTSKLNGTTHNFTAFQFKHKNSGKCLDHSDAGIVELSECKDCCNSAKSQEWLKKDAWTSYFMINTNSDWDICMGVDPNFLASVHTKKCDYYENGQWGFHYMDPPSSPQFAFGKKYSHYLIKSTKKWISKKTRNVTKIELPNLGFDATKMKSTNY